MQDARRRAEAQRERLEDGEKKCEIGGKRAVARDLEREGEARAQAGRERKHRKAKAERERVRAEAEARANRRLKLEIFARENGLLEQ